MDEIEVKFRVSGPKEIRERLRKLGALREGLVHEKNVVFDTKDGSFRKGDRILRLRDAKKMMLTYKGPRDSKSAYKKRVEINLEVKYSDRVIELLNALGYVPDWCYEKKRETWYLGKATIAIDETPGMGFFVEIEGRPEDINSTIKKMGFSESEKITKSYRELWQEYLEQNNLESGRDMVFEDGLQKTGP